MIRETRTYQGLRDISIRIVSEYPILLVGGSIYCELGIPIRYLRVDEKEVKLEISLEKLRNLAKWCKDITPLIEKVINEVELNLPEGIFSIVRIYADGLKLKELSYLEEQTPLGKGIIIDETREIDTELPPHAKENREKIIETLREIVYLEVLYAHSPKE
mgnify:CR=1 FL=1